MSTTDAPRRRRRANADAVVTIFWRDIPAQVTTTKDGVKGSWLLQERFQVAIDRAASVAGLTTADDYVQQWRRVSQPYAQSSGSEPDAAAKAEAERLQEAYNPARIQTLVDNGGLEPDNQSSTQPEAAIAKNT